MNDFDRQQRKLERIQQAQLKAEERLQSARVRMNQRFDRMRDHLKAEYGDPTDMQQRIIAAALELLDREGLNNLSLRKLAATLDMQAPALYWHFKNKEVLIDYMAETILQAELKNLRPRDKDETWQDWLIATCQLLRKAMGSRRDGARIVAGAHLFPAITLMQLFETAQESLISTGMEARQAELIVTTAVHFTFGRVIEEQSSPSPEQLKNFDFKEMLKDFPHMHASVKRMHEDMARGYDEFEASLRLITGYPK